MTYFVSLSPSPVTNLPQPHSLWCFLLLLLLSSSHSHVFFQITSSRVVSLVRFAPICLPPSVSLLFHPLTSPNPLLFLSRCFPPLSYLGLPAKPCLPVSSLLYLVPSSIHCLTLLGCLLTLFLRCTFALSPSTASTPQVLIIVSSQLPQHLFHSTIRDLVLLHFRLHYIYFSSLLPLGIFYASVATSSLHLCVICHSSINPDLAYII